VSLPRIAITAGEPAGIGPELLGMLAQEPWEAELVAIGNTSLLAERAAAIGQPLQLRDVDPASSPRRHQPGQLPCLDIPLGAPSQAGQLDPANAPHVLHMLEAAIDGCLAGDFAAMVTAPVQKSIINEAGVPFSGHTEFLAERTRTQQVVMLLVADSLRVALATTHLPLSEVPGAISERSLARTLHILHRDLVGKFGIAEPRISVLGLNPHAGEGGHLGREEIEVITPVLESLRREGLLLRGPLPADTAFKPDLLTQTDAYLAMFHDQGLPVLKYAGFGNAVNVTLGLPIIRTSVDHGTALELAGTGQASIGSLRAAVDLAISLAGKSPGRPREET
tara:strand:- start:271673 stop:272680 length:1008 start_codon:yes stop_codon:yes gene_type:complete